jgi:hypothetical protein
MSSMNLTHFGRLGFESRNLSRRAHRADFHTEPLERRELLSTGQITPVAGPNPSPHVDGPVAPAPVVSTAVSASATTPTLPTAISATITANPPTNNSSTTNIPGVSPTVPATLNVATDDSPSVTTSPSSAISALIPEASGFVSFTGGPVFIVPMADSSISELAIESPESPAPNSTVLPQLSGLALILHPINAPMNFQTNLAPATLQNQPAVVVPPHVGQSLETELQKPVKPELGPDAGVPPLIDVVDPFKPLEPTQPGKTGQPRPEESKTQQPGTEQPKAEPPAEAKPTPMQELPPFWWLGAPIPIPLSVPAVPPAQNGAAPASSGVDSPQTMQAPPEQSPALAALVGVAAAAGSLRLAMGESRRFRMHWLPSRAASSRSARPHIAGR